MVDASVWASRFIAVDAWHGPSRDWFRRVRSEGALIIGPSILFPEVASAVSRRTGRSDFASGAISRLDRLVRLRLVSVDLRIARQAAQLAGDLRLSGADAIYTSLAQIYALPLVTWDKNLSKRAESVVAALTPAELLVAP